MGMELLQWSSECDFKRFSLIDGYWGPGNVGVLLSTGVLLLSCL